MFQTKEQDKTPEEPSEVDIGNLPKKKFRVMIVNMTKELRRRMDALSENLDVFNKELENIKEQQNRDEKYSN